MTLQAVSARPNLPDVARHVIHRSCTPRVFGQRASHDVTSNVCQALPASAEALPMALRPTEHITAVTPARSRSALATAPSQLPDIMTTSAPIARELSAFPEC